MAMKTKPCSSCGKPVPYKTKPAKYCSACRKPTKKRYKHKAKGSKGERSLFYLLNSMIHSDSINNGYYSFLLSPKGAPLQLDRYYPDLKLAFEYDGVQHSEYVEYFHHTKKDFEYLQTCDAIKSKICGERGITLIRIKHNEPLTEEYVLRRIADANTVLYNKMKRKGILG